ncbi:hypothetical protein [Streptomyces sp. NPDC058330]|uniref:hypothetical protein n=1 Tax=Streptomyces sp. NPDC058330 TaxID=3346449 RepID=UPI0036ED8E67
MTSRKHTGRREDETGLEEVTEEAERAARRPVPSKAGEDEPLEGDAISPSPRAQEDTAKDDD